MGDGLFRDQRGGQVQALATLHPQLAPILAAGAGILVATLAGLANGVMVVGLRLVPDSSSRWALWA